MSEEKVKQETSSPSSETRKLNVISWSDVLNQHLASEKSTLSENILHNPDDYVLIKKLEYDYLLEIEQKKQGDRMVEENNIAEEKDFIDEIRDIRKDYEEANTTMRIINENMTNFLKARNIPIPK